MSGSLKLKLNALAGSIAQSIIIGAASKLPLATLYRLAIFMCTDPFYY